MSSLLDMDPDYMYNDEYDELIDDADDYDDYGDNVRNKTFYEEALVDKAETAIGNVIGSSHPADAMGAAGALVHEMCLERTAVIEKEPISGKEHKALSNVSDFKSIGIRKRYAGRHVSQFENYVREHLAGNGNKYKKNIEKSINSLFNDLFQASIDDFYMVLINGGHILKAPVEKSFVNLANLKKLAEKSIETGERSFIRLINTLKEEGINFKKEFLND